MMKRKIIRLMLIGLTAFVITGCENLSEVIPPDPDDEIVEIVNDAEENQEKETTDDDSLILTRTPMSDVFYICDDDSITTIDRKELAKDTDTEDSDQYRLYSEYEYSMSMLVGEGDGFLFFKDNVVVEFGNTSRNVVYAVSIDDHKIYDIWQGSTDGMLDGCEYYNGLLYIDYIIGYDDSYKMLGEDVICYRYDEKTDSFVEESPDPNLEQIVKTANTYSAHIRNSENLCFAHVYDDCGYLPAVLDGEPVLIKPDKTIHYTSGLEEAYTSYYDSNHIFSILRDYETYEGKAYVYDIASDELTEISDERGADKLLGKSGKKYYYNVPGQEEYGIKHNYIYEYDSETGLIKFIYDEKSTPGSGLQPGIEGFSVNDKYIFYIGFENGDTFWKKVNIGDPGLPYVRYDISRDPIFDYGTVSYMSTTDKCPDCGTDLVCTYNEYLVLADSVTDYADTINDYLYENALGFVNAENTEISDSPCEDHKDHPEWYRITNDYYVSGVRKICGHFLTVDMSGYWYGGGAHGYPYRDQYLFDLDTGEALTITDFYDGSETEFKTLIAEKTEENFYSYDLEDYGSPYFASNGGDVYEQAYEYSSLDSGTIDFTEDGIIYYYPPYDMGPYASGFIEIFIPYDELLGRDSL